METNITLSKLTFKPPELVNRENLLKAELNIARFSAFIFAPSHSKSDRSRVKNWIVETLDGEEVLARIIVEPVAGVSLNTFDFKIFLALQKIRLESIPNPDGTVSLSLKRLGRILDLTWGKQTFQQIKSSLGRLRKVPITWQFSFLTRESKKPVYFEEPMTLLEKLTLWVQGDDSLPGKSVFRINQQIEKNSDRNYTKSAELVCPFRYHPGRQIPLGA